MSDYTVSVIMQKLEKRSLVLVIKLKLLSVFRTATTTRRRRLTWHAIADHAQFSSHALPQYFPHDTLFACIELVAMLKCCRTKCPCYLDNSKVFFSTTFRL